MWICIRSSPTAQTARLWSAPVQRTKHLSEADEALLQKWNKLPKPQYCEKISLWISQFTVNPGSLPGWGTSFCSGVGIIAMRASTCSLTRSLDQYRNWPNLFLPFFGRCKCSDITGMVHIAMTWPLWKIYHRDLSRVYTLLLQAKNKWLHSVSDNAGSIDYVYFYLRHSPANIR